MRQQREAELAANQITQARADAEQNIIQQEAKGERGRANPGDCPGRSRGNPHEGRRAHGLRTGVSRSAQAGVGAGVTKQVATALASGQFVNFGTSGGDGHRAAAAGSDDLMRVVQTLMAAQVITGGNGITGAGSRRCELAADGKSIP